MLQNHSLLIKRQITEAIDTVFRCTKICDFFWIFPSYSRAIRASNNIHIWWRYKDIICKQRRKKNYEKKKEKTAIVTNCVVVMKNAKVKRKRKTTTTITATSSKCKLYTFRKRRKAKWRLMKKCSFLKRRVQNGQIFCPLTTICTLTQTKKKCE